MKKRTRIIVWVWIAYCALQGLFGVAWQMLRPSEWPAFAPPVVSLLIGVLFQAFFVFAGFALLGGKRWAWWVVVIWSGMGCLEIINLGHALPAQIARHPLVNWYQGTMWLSVVINVVVFLTLWGDRPPWDLAARSVSTEADRARWRGEARTRLIAWLWLFAGLGLGFGPVAWISGHAFPGTSLAVLIGIILANTFVAGLIILAALAVLRGTPWGWYVLVTCSALGALLLVLVAALTWWSEGPVTPQHGAPAGLAMCVPAAVCILILLGLLADSPRGWAAGDLPAPTVDDEEAAAEPTEEEVQPHEEAH
ncbi:MAG TPA: hypothetical protein VGM19_08180 [Armatimonadota bacterium]|jgi:hypothetical protein